MSYITWTLSRPRGGGVWSPRQLWKFITSKPLELLPPNLVTLVLKFIWEHFDISLPCPSTLRFLRQPYFDRHVFAKLRFFSYLIWTFQFFNIIFTFWFFADLKWNNFRRTIHPQSLIAVPVIFSELGRGASGGPPPPSPRRSRKSQKSPVWIGLRRYKESSGSLHLGMVGRVRVKLTQQSFWSVQGWHWSGNVK